VAAGLKGSAKSAGGAKAVVKLGIGLIALLQNEEVRRGLRGASAGLRRWADRRGVQLARTARERRGPMVRLGERFGHASLERRIDSLAAVVPEITAVRPELATELHTAEADLRRALNVAHRMPTAQRWRAQRAISGRLDEIEKSLVDAVLSPM
jgi:hypothetical protein